MKDLKESYKGLVNAYYQHNAKVVYGIDYLKKNSVDKNIRLKFSTLVENLYIAFKNLKKMKSQLNLSMCNFNSYRGENFYIESGRIVGDIKSAEAFSSTLFKQYCDSLDIHSEEQCRNFELALYLKWLISRLPKDTLYVDPKQSPSEDESNIEKRLMVNKEIKNDKVEIIKPEEIKKQPEFGFSVFNNFTTNSINDF
ncbi:MAG: hypothetical protein MJA82_14440 [Clostridia bacterium]|nr:hypothetical protein [Clostridia bacterium]